VINLTDIADQLEGWFDRTKSDAEQFLTVHAPGLREMANATADDLGKLVLGAGEVVIPAELRGPLASMVTAFVKTYLDKPAAEPEPAPAADVPVDPTP
jgi:hypothetical protein